MERDTEQEFWTRLRNRRRWSRADAEWALVQWQASKESLEEFSDRHGIAAQRLVRWRRRADKRRGPRAGLRQSAPPAGPLTLVPVTVRGSAAETANRNAVVVAVAGMRIEILDTKATAAAWVAALVGQVRS